MSDTRSGLVRWLTAPDDDEEFMWSYRCWRCGTLADAHYPYWLCGPCVDVVSDEEIEWVNDEENQPGVPSWEMTPLGKEQGR
jgi:hypothetical protein